MYEDILSVFGPKGSKMVNLDVCDHLGPFWARQDPFGPFQTKNDFLLKSTSAKHFFVLMGQQIDFCLKWPKSRGLILYTIHYFS